MPKAVALIGMPGAGKSSVGKHLAQKMGMSLWDTDVLCEQKAGMPVARIFAEKGEAYFRTLETHALADCLQKGMCVIACGGGTPTSPENARFLKHNCLVVYLQATARTLNRRVAENQTRPLLAGNTAVRLRKLLGERARIYKSIADITVRTNGCTAEQSAEKVMRAIGRRAKRIGKRER